MGATLTQHIWKFAHLPLVKLFTTPLPTIPSPVYCQRTCTWFVTKWLLAVYNATINRQSGNVAVEKMSQFAPHHVVFNNNHAN